MSPANEPTQVSAEGRQSAGSLPSAFSWRLAGSAFGSRVPISVRVSLSRRRRKPLRLTRAEGFALLGREIARGCRRRPVWQLVAPGSLAFHLKTSLAGGGKTMPTENPRHPAEPEAPEQDSIPVPPDQQPVYPIEDPPASPDPAPIDEGPKGPKQIARSTGSNEL
jgi:hypothetical protein